MTSSFNILWQIANNPYFPPSNDILPPEVQAELNTIYNFKKQLTDTELTALQNHPAGELILDFIARAYSYFQKEAEMRISANPSPILIEKTLKHIEKQACSALKSVMARYLSLPPENVATLIKRGIVLRYTPYMSTESDCMRFPCGDIGEAPEFPEPKA